MADNYPDDRKADDRKENIELNPSSPKTGGPQPGGNTRRGFAAMDERTQREIASKGGHSQGKENNRGNFWHDRERAREAGRKGGEAHGRNRQEAARSAERH
jgi:general stress protein YciG